MLNIKLDRQKLIIFYSQIILLLDYRFIDLCTFIFSGEKQPALGRNAAKRWVPYGSSTPEEHFRLVVFFKFEIVSAKMNFCIWLSSDTLMGLQQ